ncbi:MAG TPA: MFS transporter [Stackebrandtia sp.]|uniref:MFS transporter n=1 Tax=Stackebrandtia sp. TaxID=2023065 RepID=UPI002D5E955F|nr:MFS transporter [Stackebrandtia sp.]HZE42044.1 MFS transporter [Stackebrandtia sp.]
MTPTTTPDRAERLIIPATLITCLGNNIQLTAAALLVLGLDHSAMSMAWVFIAVAVPQALLSAPAGWLADRFDRRGLCLTCDLVSAVLAAAIPATLALGLAAPPVIYTATLGLAAVSALFTTASTALVKERVNPTRLGRFGANFDMATSAGNLLSTALGGVAVQVFGPEPLFAVNAVTFAGSAVCWFLIGRRHAPAPTPETAPRPRPAEDQRGPLARLGTLFGLTTIILMASNVLIVLLVIQMFHQPPGVLGVIDGLAGCGMLLGGFIYKRLSSRVNDVTRALVGFLGLLAVIGLQPNIGPVGMLLFLPGGIAFGLSRVASRNLLLTHLGSDSAGRDFGIINAVGMGCGVAVTVAVSLTADLIAPRHAFTVLAIVVVAIAPATAASLRRARVRDVATVSAPVTVTSGR